MDPEHDVKTPKARAGGTSPQSVFLHITPLPPPKKEKKNKTSWVLQKVWSFCEQFFGLQKRLDLQKVGLVVNCLLALGASLPKGILALRVVFFFFFFFFFVDAKHRLLVAGTRVEHVGRLVAIAGPWTERQQGVAIFPAPAGDFGAIFLDPTFHVVGEQHVYQLLISVLVFFSRGSPPFWVVFLLVSL